MQRETIENRVSDLEKRVDLLEGQINEFQKVFKEIAKQARANNELMIKIIGEMKNTLQQFKSEHALSNPTGFRDLRHG
jgi:uncharacterized coiled-coil protein SlyX